MENTLELNANPIWSFVHLLHNPPVFQEAMSLSAAITMMSVAMDLHGTDSAVIKTGYAMLPRVPEHYRFIVAGIIGSRSPIKYMQELMRRITDEDLVVDKESKPALPFSCYCGAVDAETRREALKKRYPEKHRRKKSTHAQRAA